jgi:hypothetical protein
VNIKILDRAELDLFDGFHFYEKREAGLGFYFLENLHADIESLKLTAGIHLKSHNDFYRLLAKRFPFAIYYKMEGDTAFIHAVVDGRRNPVWIRERLN